MSRNLWMASAMLALLIGSSSASAQVVFLELTDASSNNVPLGNTVTVAPGGSFTYRAWLVADATARSQIDGDGGLGSAIIKVVQSVATLASAATPVGASPPWPTVTTVGSTAAAPALNLANFGAAGTVDSQSFGTNGQAGYILGTFTFTAGSTAGSDILTLRSTNDANGDIGSYNGNFNYGGTSIDRTTTFTVSPVPEPGSLALGGLAVAAGVAARWRRRKPAAAEAE